MDPALKVWMSFSSLSYCLIIVLTRWHARGHETARHRHWQMSPGNFNVHRCIACTQVKGKIF
ncbi:Hypothetical protein SMAX5B_009624 [Scophthalmus maximus]|uniref:Uncharacterized protein n=1 Tax=Scophthalmus maximus TaxID=52904 RepID=A0A2U9CYZ2_SCOMX|nr:Hypothetical protein SMAX5B_009624 [Scophthalmus maximus]